jgi:Fe-S cluster biogenesis protein NfuA
MTSVLVHTEQTGDADRLRWVVSGGGRPSAAALLDRLAGLGIETVAEHSDAYDLTKSSTLEWRAIGDDVRARLSAALAEAADDRPTVETVDEVIERAAGDLVRSHGGSVTVRSVAPDRVVLELSGACAGCRGAASTVDHLIGTAIRRRFPVVAHVDFVRSKPGLRWRISGRRA